MSVCVHHPSSKQQLGWSGPPLPRVLNWLPLIRTPKRRSGMLSPIMSCMWRSQMGLLVFINLFLTFLYHTSAKVLRVVYIVPFFCFQSHPVRTERQGLAQCHLPKTTSWFSRNLNLDLPGLNPTPQTTAPPQLSVPHIYVPLCPSITQLQSTFTRMEWNYILKKLSPRILSVLPQFWKFSLYTRKTNISLQFTNEGKNHVVPADFYWPVGCWMTEYMFHDPKEEPSSQRHLIKYQRHNWQWLSYFYCQSLLNGKDNTMEPFWGEKQ